jgi:6-phospho-3-hexuloisomerase
MSNKINTKVSFSELKDIVLEELEGVLDKISEKEVRIFINAISTAERVFVIGAGRSFLISKTFAKRLTHLRIDSYVVGETITPNIKKGDLLVVSSGSGETMIPANISNLAKKYGAKIAVVTANIESTLGRIGDFSVRIPCPIKPHLLVEEDCSIQPMHNLFEQCLLLFFDCV